LVNPEIREQAEPKDVARAVLECITNNIGSLVNLHAKTLNISNVIFAGNFLRKNKISIARLSFAMDFWSKGGRQATFLTHEGCVETSVVQPLLGNVCKCELPPFGNAC
jgi:type II pantothenate kinase